VSDLLFGGVTEFKSPSNRILLVVRGRLPVGEDDVCWLLHLAKAINRELDSVARRQVPRNDSAAQAAGR
jgi:hypothetical protein